MSTDSQSTRTEFLRSLARFPEGAELKTFKGACHCRKFTYELNHPSLVEKKPISCNCTFCTKVGTMNVFVLQDLFHLDGSPTSWDEISKFKAKSVPTTHHFCPGCGCYTFWTGMGIVGVNVRMFDGIEVENLDVVHVDGRNRK